ncbi:serpin family protein [Lagierella sp.]|uniref:serpin family protein n=1 Tax=Lagierella sp. TaxID=2849657 RepID=UPI00260C4BD5|nr:serpin family protein [Lagierella sp.]
MKDLLILLICIVLLVSCVPRKSIIESDPVPIGSDYPTDAETDIDEGDVLAYFSTTTFRDIVKSNYKENIVYSPYSYGQAINQLTKITDDFKKNDLIKRFYNKDISGIKLSNIKTANLIMANREFFDLKENAPDNLKLASFPKEAENISRELQEKIIGKVLLEPEYDKEQSNIILNATKFDGKWVKPFESKNTIEDAEFKTFDGVEKVNLMTEENPDGKLGYEDEYAAVTRKEIKSDNKNQKSYAYILVPKETREEYLEKIALNIGTYIYHINHMPGEYDSVILQIPKIDLKSKLDLLKLAKENFYGLEKPFKLKEDVLLSKSSDSVAINEIKQVATLSIDEREVKAEAVTEIGMKLTSAPSQEKKTLEVIANRPYFVVLTSESENGIELITFTALVNNPNKTE